MILLLIFMIVYFIVRVARRLQSHEIDNHIDSREVAIVVNTNMTAFLQQFYDLSDVERLALGHTVRLNGPAQSAFAKACSTTDPLQRAAEFQAAVTFADEPSFLKLEQALTAATYARHLRGLDAQRSSPPVVAAVAVSTPAVPVPAVPVPAVPVPAVPAVAVVPVTIPAVTPSVQSHVEEPTETESVHLVDSKAEPKADIQLSVSEPKKARKRKLPE